MAQLKDKLLKEFYDRGYEVGDFVCVQGKYLKCNKQRSDNDWNSLTVKEVLEDGRLILSGSERSEDEIVNPSEVEVKKDELFIGANPLPEIPWNRYVRSTGFTISYLMSICREIIESGNVADTINGVDVAEFNFNPYIVDSEGNKQYYQRDYCWTLEDEQNFIESIYNNMNLGSIVLRRRDYKFIDEETRKGNHEVAFTDVVDGKQRLHTILRWMNDEFPDRNGIYYSDLSKFAKRRLAADSMGLNIMEIREGATDEDTLRVFLNVNYAGRPMSKEHLDYVKSLYQKK